MSESTRFTPKVNLGTGISRRRRLIFYLFVARLFATSHSLLLQPPNTQARKLSVETNVLDAAGISRYHSRRIINPATIVLRSKRWNVGQNRQNAIDDRNAKSNLGFPASLSRTKVSVICDAFRQVRNDVINQLRNGRSLDQVKPLLTGMIDYLQEIDAHGYSIEVESTYMSDDSELSKNGPELQRLTPELQKEISEMIDEAFQSFYARSFAKIKIYDRNWYNTEDQKIAMRRVTLGIEMLQLQLRSSNFMSAPYHNVPKNVIVQALAAVTVIQENQSNDFVYGRGVMHPDTAFRLLQRLVTGKGIRGTNRSLRNGKNGDVPPKIRVSLHEADFNRVLNVYSSSGKMEMAHRIVALQERTPHAPDLSTVTYSILVKGYGKLCDSQNIDALLRQAALAADGSPNGMKPDTVLFNSFMDAYINCRQLSKARTILMAMILNNDVIKDAVRREETNCGPESKKVDFFSFSSNVCPPPNLRSYNILLKGYASEGLLEDALKLAAELNVLGALPGMKGKWWDHVTTNTLVQAAVVAKRFEVAQNLLEKNSLSEGIRNKQRETNKKTKYCDHPNADAYTSLMRGYAKDGKLKEAINVLQLMERMDVKPNEYHYSCLVSFLAREGKIDHAEKLLVRSTSMSNIYGRRQRAVYNAFISGLAQVDGRFLTGIDDNDYDKRIDKSLSVLREMVEKRIMPDSNTVAIILDGLGRCSKPRIKEALTVVERLESQGIIPPNHLKVTTALIRVCGACQSLDAAISCFRRITRPDTPAVNALIDAAMRSGKEKYAIGVFHRYFLEDSPRFVPDVISFSTMMTIHLKKGTYEGCRAARQLYQDMRFKRRILPDKILVDTIVKGIVHASRTCGVQATDARFAAGVLRDAEKLAWDEGQLERRKFAVESAMNQYVATAWEEESELYGLWRQDTTSSNPDQNNMFERYGWNTVDSGFCLWGAGKKNNEKAKDHFLVSKGWNDMDSGFRVF